MNVGHQVSGTLLPAAQNVNKNQDLSCKRPVTYPKSGRKPSKGIKFDFLACNMFYLGFFNHTILSICLHIQIPPFFCLCFSESPWYSLFSLLEKNLVKSDSFQSLLLCFSLSLSAQPIPKLIFFLSSLFLQNPTCWSILFQILQIAQNKEALF